MLKCRHHVVNILYSIKGMTEAYLTASEEQRNGPGSGGNGFPKLESQRLGSGKNRCRSLERAEGVLRKIYCRAEEALRITRRIGLIAEAGDDPAPAEAYVSVKAVWQEAVELLKRRRSFERFEVFEIITHIPDAYPAVRCRSEDLFEIFYTLAQNALQAMASARCPLNAKMIIRANLQLSPEGNTAAVITVSDTGPGIPEELLGRLFEPFFTTKPINEGNGLGLCLVKSLARKNGGSVAVSSFRGAGTTFTLTFPISSKSFAAEPVAA